MNEVGCYIDTGARDLEGPYVTTADMTPENCVLYCGRNNFRYAGVQVRKTILLKSHHNAQLLLLSSAVRFYLSMRLFMNHIFNSKIKIFTFRLVVIVSVVRHTVNMAVTAPPQNVQLSVVEMQPEHVEEHGGTLSTMSEVTESY